MAASDNVIRAGLTPKFKDVAELVDSLTYRTDSLTAASFPAAPHAKVQSYVPPAAIPEFRLDRVRVDAKGEALAVTLQSASIFIVVGGDGAASLDDAAAPTRLYRGAVVAALQSAQSETRTLRLCNTGAEPLVVFVAQARGAGAPLVAQASHV